MVQRVQIRRAPTVKDLLDQVDAATYLLGLDALWTGYKDGRIYMWREDKDVELCIEPKTLYRCATALAEVVR